jgi:uncharacterized damage-inducible protein DinB
MNFMDAFRGEFSHEAASTRKMLERAPMDKGEWRPHAKSMTMRQLVSHIVEIPHWAQPTLQSPEMNFDMANYKPALYSSTAELLAAFDTAVKDTVRLLGEASEKSLGETWRLKIDGKVVFEMPRAAVLRTMILNHMIHHRGQMSVFLRLNDVPVPQVYGPTADESMGM